jgi:hypothetical protein
LRWGVGPFYTTAMLRRPSVLGCALITLSLAACGERYPPLPEVWVDPPIATHHKSETLPPGTDEGAGPDGSLLEGYADRTPREAKEIATWQLPFQAKTMVVELLIAAAKDDPNQMLTLLSSNARFGLPDRRELRARPISSKKDPLGLEFLAAFRSATSRFSKKASFTCTPLQPGWQNLAASGAEPVWCSYTSSDNLDILGFRFVVEGGRVKTDYVGFFTHKPAVAMRVPSAGDPPPLTPYVKHPVELKLPDLMPDGSNPVVDEKKKPAGEPAAEDVDAPIPVPAREG